MDLRRTLVRKMRIAFGRVALHVNKASVVIELVASGPCPSDYSELIFVPAQSRVVMHKHPLPRIAALATQLGNKTPAVDLVHPAVHSCDFGNRGPEIGRVDQVLAHGTTTHHRGPRRNQENPGAGIGRSLFSSAHGSVNRIRDDSHARTMIGVEEDQRVLAQPVVLEVSRDPSNQMIDVLDHIAEVLVLVCEPITGSPIVAVGRGVERCIGKGHREVAKPRAIPMPGDEIEQEIGIDIRPVLPLERTMELAVDLNDRIRVSRTLLFGLLRVPETPFVKAGLPRKRARVTPFRQIVGWVV